MKILSSVARAGSLVLQTYLAVFAHDVEPSCSCEDHFSGWGFWPHIRLESRHAESRSHLTFGPRLEIVGAFRQQPIRHHRTVFRIRPFDFPRYRSRRHSGRLVLAPLHTNDAARRRRSSTTA